MNVRDLFNLPESEQQTYSIEGKQIRQIEYRNGAAMPYEIWLATGEYITARGHDNVASLNLNAYKPVSSHARIRHYGEFGSTIN